MHHLPRCLAVVGVSLLCLPSLARGAEIEGVTFADRLSLEGQELELHGAGLLRYRVFFRGFVAALYLDDPVPGGAAASEVLSDRPKRLEIEYFWGIPAHEFARATREGIAQNSPPGMAVKVAPQMRELNALYRDVEPGDRYALTYLPGRGTELALNGEVLGVVAGADFSSALFSVWLGRKPFDRSLRRQLLARWGGEPGTRR